MPFPRLPDLPSLPRRPEAPVPQRINRAPSPLPASGLPWGSGTLAPLALFPPVMSSAPGWPRVAGRGAVACRRAGVPAVDRRGGRPPARH